MTRLLRALGVLLYRLGLDRPVRWLNRQAPRVLLYHACDFEESDFIAGLDSNTNPATFAVHLEFLAEHYRVISLETLERGPVPDRAVVITFDDGYRSVFRNAYPLLRAHGMPATTYLVAATLDNRALIWVNELNWFLRRFRRLALPLAAKLRGLGGGLTEDEVIQDAMDRASPEAVEALLENLAKECEVDRQQLAQSADLYLTHEDISEMIDGGMTFGNHTATHANLALCSPDVTESELNELISRPPPGFRRTLAYPFGIYTDVAREMAVAVGHQSIMQLGGVNRPLALSSVARTPVSARTHAELFAEMEVVAPIKALLRGLFRRDPYGYRHPLHGFGTG